MQSLCMVGISKDYNRPFYSSILSLSQCIWALILPHANYKNLRKVEFQLCHQAAVLRTKQTNRQKPLTNNLCMVVVHSAVSDSCSPIDSNTSGFPVFHHFLEHPQICPLNWWCHPTVSSSVIIFSCLQSFPALGSFQMSWLFASGGQSIGASAAASVLPMNIQDWFPLGLTSWISLQAKGFSERSPTPQFQSINSLVLHLLYGPTLTSIHEHW